MSSWRALPFGAAYRRAFVVLLVSGCCLNAYFLLVQWWGLARGYADFTIFYSAADIVRSDQAKDLYSEQVQYFAQRAVAPDVNIRNMALPYNHPPFEALIFVPLSYLPYLAAYLLWAAMNMGFLFVAIRLLRPSGLSTTPVPVLFAAALGFFPVFITLFQGQDLLLLLLIISAAYAFIRRGHDFRAGCSLGLGLFRPELILPMTLLIFLNRGRRFAAGFASAAVSLIVISFSIVGWQSLRAYPKYVWRIERVHGYGSIVPADMPNLRGLISLFFHNERMLLIATVVASLAVFAFSVWQIRPARILGNTERIFSFGTLCSLLISFHALKHDLTLLVVPIMFVCAECAQAARGALDARVRAFLLWPVLFLFCTPALVFLWLGLGKFCLVALVLAAWFWSFSTVWLPGSEELRFSAGQA